METNDLECLWSFDKDLYPDCKIKCPECGYWSNHRDWKESEVGCDLCGSHSAVKCPECSESFDHVHGPVFEVQ